MLNCHIVREEYLNKLIAFRDKNIIKVITGVRRCGKSTLLEMYADYLLAQGVTQEQIIFVNLEDYDFLDLREPKALHGYVKERLLPNQKMYIFIDEIQHCEDFPRVIDSLFIKKNTDIYLTGSNAYMLSTEIATLLSGRYVELPMLPLSFKEYVQTTGNFDNLSAKYLEYIGTSSFPYSLELKGQENELKNYLEGIHSTIIMKDVINRIKITDVMMFESVTQFIFHNIGSLLSTKKIADTMTSSGRKIDVKTVEKYIHGLSESFIIYQAKRYNIKGKEYLKTLDKYYVVDMGLRNMLLSSRSLDVGHMLENVVYLELLRRGYKVYVGKIDDLEVDFVAMNHKETFYVQVAATVRDSQTLERELASLKKINDSYPKLILTLDEDPDTDFNGIRRINALNWLVGK